MVRRLLWSYRLINTAVTRQTNRSQNQAQVNSLPPSQHSLTSTAAPFSHTALPLWLIVILTLAGYILLRFWLPLAPSFSQAPLPDIRTFTPSLAAGLAYAVLLLLLFALYIRAFQQVRQMNAPPRLALILLATILFGLPLLQTFPFNATDVYRYFIRGRVYSVYQQSPFATPPNSFRDDPFLPLAGEWADETSPYGPIWELTAATIGQVSEDNLYLSLILFKALGLTAHTAGAALIWGLLHQAKTTERAALTLLWAWNPALLLTFVVDAHNDALMLTCLLLGLWLLRRGWTVAGFITMVVAALIKPIALLPLPLFFLATWRELPNDRSRIRFLLLSGIGSLAAVWLAFLPFGSPLDLVERLGREASAGGGFSLLALVILISQALDVHVPVDFLTYAGYIFFGLVVVWLFWQTWRGRSPVRGTADIFAAYIVQALNFRLWYTTWPFAWLVLDEAGHRDEHGRLSFRLEAGLWLLLTTQLSVLIYGHLRVYALGGDHLPAHLIGVPFTFGLPLLLAARKRGDVKRKV